MRRQCFWPPRQRICARKAVISGFSGTVSTPIHFFIRRRHCRTPGVRHRTKGRNRTARQLTGPPVFGPSLGQVTEHYRLGSYTLSSDYSYDPGTGQLVTLQQTSDDGSTFTNLATASYTNDAAGNVTKIATTSAVAATDTQCFGYDRLQELTRAWTPSSGDCSTAPTAASLVGPAPYWTDYAVDPGTGNRTGTTSTTSSAVTASSYAYPSATSLHPHAVSSVTTTVGAGTPSTKSYGYNAEGDTTTRPGETLTYDPEGHLATVTDGGNTQTNTYDADGTLLLQKDGSNYTLYLGPTELHKDGSAAVYAVRTYSLAGTAVAERTTGPTGGNTLRWLGGDNHNTATIEVAANTGTTTVRYEDPYGNPRGTNPGWSSGHTFLNDDQATTSSTVTIGARTYDPVIGKFLTVDAVLTPFSPLATNGYSYGANSPIDFSDPSGNCMLNLDSNRCFLSAKAADTASANTPPAWVSISPHVYVPGGDKELQKQASNAYSAARSEYGFSKNDQFTSELQEMDLWASYCCVSQRLPR